jgi:hypothetical protein
MEGFHFCSLNQGRVSDYNAVKNIAGENFNAIGSPIYSGMSRELRQPRRAPFLLLSCFKKPSI